MPPALVMAIETLELSPLFSTKVPPARTGLAVTPILLKPTLVPVTMSDGGGGDEDEDEDEEEAFENREMLLLLRNSPLPTPFRVIILRSGRPP